MNQMEPFDAGTGWCPCGSAWFELAVPPDVDEPWSTPAAVCIDPDGNITGYAGVLACIECGEPWRPGVNVRRAKGHLRLLDITDFDDPTPA